MTVIDLHPEELLDRAQRGTLTPAQRARLDQHLAECVACRMELLLREDFAVEDGDEGLSRLVSTALKASATAPAPPLVERRRTRVVGWHLLVAAMMSLLAGLAAAQIESVARVMGLVTEQAKQLLSEAQPALQRKHTKRSSPPAPALATTPPAALAPPPLPSEPAPESGAASSEQQRGVQAKPTHAPARVATVRAVRTKSGDATALPLAPALPVRDLAPAVKGLDTGAPAPATASQLFDRASALRRRADATGAIALYRELQVRFAGTPEARLALAVVARLELDRGRSAEALRDFDAYLASGDAALVEEALAGRALALFALGRTAEACSAFAVLMQSFPASGYRAVAAHRCERHE